MHEPPPPPGRFVWHDLMSADPEASRRFYAELFGWDVREEEIPPVGDYSMVFAGDTPIGGIVPLDDPDRGTHWIGYVEVPDVDAAAAAARAAGGQVRVPPLHLEGIGRFAVVTDPSGGSVCPFTGAEGPRPEPGERPAPGTFCWDELVTTDLESAEAFYPRVFPWGTHPMQMPEFRYVLCRRSNDRDTAGMMQVPLGQPGACTQWIPYVAVEDVDESAARAQTLGARVCHGPAEIPHVGRFAVLADPQGALFAVFRGA